MTVKRSEVLSTQPFRQQKRVSSRQFLRYFSMLDMAGQVKRVS
jgi:hypothetical protein